jgi:hypothetical protein
MDYFGARKYMTSEQAARMGKTSQKAQTLKRLARTDYDPIPVRSGLQLVIITLDMRTPTFREHCAMLFDANKENRYRWMLNMEKQNGLIGWHDAAREVIGQTRPLLSN